MLRYSPEFKRDLIHQFLSQKLVGPDEFLKMHPVARASFFRWLKAYGPQASGVVRRQIRPQDWGMGVRLRAILETSQMNDHELGEYLRRNGLYFSHLMEWKAEVLEEVKKNTTLNKMPSQEGALVRRIRELEREVKLKDKALREATALLALKKKAESIWGASEEEKSNEPTESKPSPSSKKPRKKVPA